MSSRTYNDSFNPSFPSSMTHNQSTYSSVSQTYETNKRPSVLKSLIRHIMRTFYSVPKSLVVEYIYHYECINLTELAKLLCLNFKQVQSYIEEFKRDKFIIEEYRKKFNVNSRKKPEPDELFYKIDIVTFVNIVKYRLANMQLRVIDSEKQQQMCEQMDYKCQQCSKEYTEFDIAKLYRNSIEDDFMCIRCNGMVEDVHQTNQKIRDDQAANMKLFNEQMTSLYEILGRIDGMMQNKQLTTIGHKIELVIDKDDEMMQNKQLAMIDRKIEVVIEKDDDDDDEDSSDMTTIIPNKTKSLPEWFVHSTVHVGSDHVN